MTAVPPDARLPGLHAEAGDPHTRLSLALADLEGAAWGLLLADQAALARQLAAHFGPGTLRVDARLGVSREVFASAGLAVATTDADWRGAKAVWLLEPDERALKRAKRADVPVIVDATLAPGGGWLEREATLIVYRDAATLSGFGDVSAAALFGEGPAPQRAAPAPSDLSLAMILRDLASLPLRLARAARTTATLLERFGGAAQATGPTALLLSPDSAADTHQPIGGVLAAARNVGIGTLITPGVQGLDAVLALLRGDESVSRPASAEPARAESVLAEPSSPAQHAQVQIQPVQPPAETAVIKTAPPEVLNYVPEIVFSDSAPHPEPESRRDESSRQEPVQLEASQAQSPAAEAGRHDFTNGPMENEEPGAELPDAALQPEPPQTRRNAPQRERRGRRDFQPRSAEPQAAQVGAEQPDEVHAEASQSEADLPEIVLTPDLPPAESKDPTEGLSDEQRATYARLRDWRNAEAKRQDISRFIIASNATLAEIARSAPRDETELRKVRGMGPERVRKYGEALLGTVQAD
ncbi:HRDC domain-containing protein [Deinococcus rubellus]|uniref:HRDC domain-containing protein n=1 Tax=Deinococcus rubellus TaxID=1889240 RepID=A0ABY5YHP6_9DEIO|nr:HRDC domain-containing protein [Deinococcus rubellus]UWX64634.1 HRDC domain-containing protein [Deinococcus rubellus]